jgi:O-antigen/teichoic acid export membrane protein
LAALVVAHTLGPSLLGEVAFAQTLAAFFGGIGDAGLTIWVYREIVLAPKRLWRLVIDTTFLQVWLALVLAAIFALIAILVPMPAGTSRLLLLFTPYLLTEALSIDYALRAFEHMVAAASIRVGAQMIASIGTIVLVLATHDPIWVPIMLWVGQLAGDAMIWWCLHARYPFERSWPHLASTRKLLRAGAPLLVTTVIMNIWAVLSTVSLAGLRSTRELGLYSAPLGLILTAWVMSEVAVGGIVPELVRRYRDDRPGFSSLVDTVVRLTSRLTLAVAAFLIVAAAPVVQLLYGSRFAASAPLLAILAPIVPLGWFAWYVGYSLLAGGERRAYAQGLAYGLAFAAVAYPIWTAAYGTTGTAIVSTLTVSIFAVALTLYARSRVGVTPVVAALEGWPYFVIPLGILLGLRVVVPFHSVIIPVLAWLVVVTAVEFANSSPTLRQLAGLRRLSPASAARLPAPGD